MATTGINRTVYDGYLARDPVLFEMKSGKQGCVFSCIWSKQYGNIHEICDLPVVCYQEARAKAIAQYCKKGSRVQIDGHLVSMAKKTKNGDDYKEVQLKIDEIFFVSSKESNAGTGKAKTEERPKKAKKAAKKSTEEDDGVKYFDAETGEIMEG